jgi:hypothetical protein
MDPEFRRILFRTLIIGVPILVIGAIALVVAFRAFAPSEKPGRDFRSALILGGAIAFVLLMCVLLLRLSMSVR